MMASGKSVLMELMGAFADAMREYTVDCKNDAPSGYDAPMCARLMYHRCCIIMLLRSDHFMRNLGIGPKVEDLRPKKCL